MGITILRSSALLSDATPEDALLGAGVAGTGELASRFDHVHGIEDTGWLTPVFQNGWVDYGGQWVPAGYRRISGVVFLRGLIKSGTIPGDAFTVPVGFRVAINEDRHIGAFSNTALGGVRVYSDGRVRIGDPGSNAWFSLDGVYWVADA